MLNKVFFPGYTLDENIHNGVNTNIYRGIIKESGSSVILKLLNSEYPSLEAIARLKHEYSVAGNLEHENIVKILRLETDDKRLAIVFEDFGGVSLKQYLENNQPSLQLILSIVIAITEALLYIHSCHIIHKDIKPANIIINHNTGEVKLTDFSIATRLSKETPQLANPNQLEGTLAYMSPEQTGRMNRVVDYRSDFYSLGVTLYEILTGEIPFNSNDPLELVHNHIAKQPDQFKIQNAKLKIPQVLCDIVMKLMAKNAEDRYQSGKGLLADFKQCQQQLLANGIINNFIPGRLDVFSQLLPSQKLYGREEQMKQLLDAFERVAIGRSELMLVSGYSGIGKTSVINEVNKPITRARGYFISGKFDQLKRDIPYACFIQALSSLLRQLLTESTDELENWKQKILILLNNYVNHWHDHLHKTITPLLDAYQSGIETGDSEYASYAALGIAFHQFYVGKELSKVQQTMEVYGKAMSQFKQLTPLMYNNICHQGVLNLLGDSITAHRLVGALYDEEVTLEQQLGACDYTGLFISYCIQLMLCYLFDKHELAIKKAFLAKKYSQGKGGLTFTIQFCLYDSLASLAIYENSSISEQNEILQQVASNQEEMYKWLCHAPMNCQHKYDLVEAELCRIKGNKYQAMDLYDLAIQGAIDNGYIQEAAVANEIAAKFYLSLGKKKNAQIYMTEAYYGYIKWGAIAKITDLEERFNDLIIRTDKIAESEVDITRTIASSNTRSKGTTTNGENLLDIASIMKASEAIQGNIILESLPRTLLYIILENAGAQKGCLILEKNGKLLIEAIDSNDKNDYLILQSIPVEESSDISQKVINYVAITKQTLVIKDAMSDPISKNCLYIQQYQCKSILCLPIIYQGKFIGILYLENNLLKHAFTPARLELIKILISQAAVALKNAKLLASSQQLTEQYRSIFESANDGLSIYDFETNKFVAINAATEKMYGYTNEEFPNLQPQDFVHPNSLHLFAEFIDKLKAGKEFFSEATVLRKDGTAFDVEVKSTYFTYNGKLHALSITRDITERKQAAKLLQQKTEDLEVALNKLQQTQSKLVHTEKISSLGQMVAGVAHEVNNPVSFINGNLSHVSQYIDDLTNLLQIYQTHYPQPVPEIESEIAAIELDYLLEDLPKMIDSMKLGTARIKDIMLSLRNFSRTDGDDKREVDIHEGIETTLMILSHRIKAKPERPAIEIIKEYTTLPKVACYPGQLNQVFMNLLANGIDALEESNQGKVYNQIDNVITISTAVSDGWVTISFADNGSGMNEEVRQKLFNAFFTTKPEGKGTGLGLSISYQIVTEKHGGTLECISSPGAGAKFVIRIPQ
ncbi:MAG: protein kinase [Scytonematopsis contorta HA4267-MV1]|jgi:PAS domain S-box-containing protein|nr:protein kinase [Scytonematopsis contorta HA4267-MV1]